MARKEEPVKIKLNDKPIQCPLCRGWFEKKWNPVRKMLYLFCHFDGIAIAAHDPFVGRWDELYAISGEVMKCLGCDRKMRFFATSTGYVQFRCAWKDCRAKIERTSPDRPTGTVLVNEKGQELDMTGIDRPMATPDAPGEFQSAGEEAPRQDRGPDLHPHAPRQRPPLDLLRRPGRRSRRPRGHGLGPRRRLPGDDVGLPAGR